MVLRFQATVIPGDAYAFVMCSVGGFGYYLVGYGSPDPYASGMMYSSGNGGGFWNSYSLFDLCFEAYGIG